MVGHYCPMTREVPAYDTPTAGSSTDIDPVAVNADSVTPIPPPIAAVPRLSDVLRAGLVTGVTAAILCSVLWAIGALFGTNFEVAAFGSATNLMMITPIQIVIVAMLSALAFAAIAASLRKRRGCRLMVLLLGYAGGLASLIAVFTQPDAVTWPTKIWLALMHLLVMVIVVPQVARVVGDSDPRATDGYRRTGLDAS